MPLNRPALTLGSGPRGVHDARRWVVRTCQDISRDDLTECAELGVSELVTNALLHGEPPIRVRVRGTARAPADRGARLSREAPILPGHLRARPGRGGAPHLRSRARHRGAQRGRLGRRDRGRRQGRLVRAGRRRRRGPRRPRRDHRHRRAPSRPDPDPGPGPRPHRQRAAPSLHRLPAALPRAAPRGPPARPGARERLPARQEPAATCSARLDRHLREGIGVEQIEAAIAANTADTDLVVHMPRSTAAHLDAGSSSCSTSPTTSAASSGCSRWPARTEQRRVPELVPLRVRAPGRGRARRSPGPIPPGPAQRRLVTPAPRRASAVAWWGLELFRWWLGDLAPDGERLPVDHLRDQRSAAPSCSPPCPPLSGGACAPGPDAALGPGLLGGFTTHVGVRRGGPRAARRADRGGTAAAYLVGTRRWPASARGRCSAERRGRGPASDALLVALGAAVGAPLRFWLAERLDSDRFPARDLAGERRRLGPAGPSWSGSASRVGRSRSSAPGSAAGFTTYSTFAVQTVGLGTRRGRRTPRPRWRWRWPAAPSATGSGLRRSRARATGRRRCRSGGRPRARR